MQNAKTRFEVRPLFLQVHDLLAQRIAFGEWLPGQQLPNELHLATELGISLGTVRKAMDELELEKIVTRRQGRGTFVADHSSADVALRFANLRNEGNELIEGQISAGRTEQTTASAHESSMLQLSEGEEVIRINRVRLYKHSPFMVETCVLPSRLYQRLPVDLESYQITLLAQENGIFLRDANETIRAVGADANTAAALQLEVGAPVLSIERMINAIDGQCVEWKSAFCNTQHVHIAVQPA